MPVGTPRTIPYKINQASQSSVFSRNIGLPLPRYDESSTYPKRARQKKDISVFYLSTKYTAHRTNEKELHLSRYTVPKTVW